jgi:hypothetical protein
MVRLDAVLIAKGDDPAVHGGYAKRFDEVASQGGASVPEVVKSPESDLEAAGFRSGFCASEEQGVTEAE